MTHIDSLGFVLTLRFSVATDPVMNKHAMDFIQRMQLLCCALKDDKYLQRFLPAMRLEALTPPTWSLVPVQICREIRLTLKWEIGVRFYSPALCTLPLRLVR
jgi:hypothetical protein